MNKNLIPEICKLLNIELQERFQIENRTDTFYFTEYGFFKVENENAKLENAWVLSQGPILIGLLAGNLKIIKLPWKPKRGEEYWTFKNKFLFDLDRWFVIQAKWENSVNEEALHKAGWIFRTKEEAAAALPAIAEKLEAKYKLPREEQLRMKQDILY